jgi:predicted Zn-dependent protease
MQRSATRIRLVPVGPLPEGIVDHLVKEVSSVFRCDVSVSSPQPKPDFAYDKKRRQYSANSIMKQ